MHGLYDEIVQAGFGDQAPYNWFASQSTRPDILAGTCLLSRNLILEGGLPALVKRIDEVHGGQIRVESEGEGCGSTFWFNYPLNTRLSVLW